MTRVSVGLVSSLIASTAGVALAAGRHLLWYVSYQTGGAVPRERERPA